MGVVSIRELREALANIYSRGAVPMYSVRKSTVSPPFALPLENGPERSMSTVATQTPLKNDHYQAEGSDAGSYASESPPAIDI
ncbi:unnamed protein product [Gongylonema pulchrum]|uniref:Late endosomal/lysosomal adaptor and MAPK and MTOR activator 1 n=1 Tax=Gongylonema pulchrum TaxID=637853 RepID=A0A183EKE2_9BILA|nr:unnamed protein product [Gongylonema pulchrum]